MKDASQEVIIKQVVITRTNKRIKVKFKKGFVVFEDLEQVIEIDDLSRFLADLLGLNGQQITIRKIKEKARR